MKFCLTVETEVWRLNGLHINVLRRHWVMPTSSPVIFCSEAIFSRPVGHWAQKLLIFLHQWFTPKWIIGKLAKCGDTIAHIRPSCIHFRLCRLVTFACCKSGVPTFLWPCTLSTFRQMSIVPLKYLRTKKLSKITKIHWTFNRTSRFSELGANHFYVSKLICCGCAINAPLAIGNCTPRDTCAPGWVPLL